MSDVKKIRATRKPDPRQAVSGAAIRELAEKMQAEGEDVAAGTVDTEDNRYHASAVDLGVLQSEVTRKLATDFEWHEPGQYDPQLKNKADEPHAFKAVEEILVARVQRLKALALEGSRVDFKTKDDWGWYAYSFSLPRTILIGEKSVDDLP